MREGTRPVSGEQKVIAVTGCGGLIGNHLSRHLLSLGHRVIGIDNLSGSYRDLLPRHENFRFHEVDLNDFESVRTVFRSAPPTTCFHFAAYAAEGLSPFIRRFNYEQNLMASASVINACVEFESKLIFASSMAVYGSQRPPFHEEMPLKPIDPYGVAKAAVEMDIQCAGDQFDLRWNVIRPHNVVGVYQNIWDKYRNVIGIFIRKALNREPLSIFGSGAQVRAFSDVACYMRPLTALIDGFDNEVFNLGGEKPLTIREVAQLVVDKAKRYRIDVQMEFLPARHEVFEAFCSHEKARGILDFHDETNLEVLLEDMFSWAISQPKRAVRQREYEITRQVYSYWDSEPPRK